ncbi:hypothetical protein ACH50O_01340 [Methylomonas sp. 2BW1-5-20]|uniref:hypothetical protein n=1 Tax=Methylomonas sp. 2BW1-5-20 TaxID=3376686 RepID=UPI00404E2E52
MFKLKHWIAFPLVVLLSAWTFNAAAGPHHHGGGHFGGHFYPRFGLYLGAPLFPRPYYPAYPYYPYYPRYGYYPPEIVTVPAQPPIYIERERDVPQSNPLPEGYWYYCNDPAGYYPYVNQCPGGWQQVEPTPQN